MRDEVVSGYGGSGLDPDGGGSTSGDSPPRGSGRPVEILGPHLRIAGLLELGKFHRVTDIVNSSNGNGLLRLSEAKVLLRDGEPSSLDAGDLWVSPSEMSVVAELETSRTVRPEDGSVVSKTRAALAIVTPGHTLTGYVYTPPGATMEVFLSSPEPAFLPMTSIRVRSLIDRHIEAEYPFALLNRRHIIAASPVKEASRPLSVSLFERLRY